MQTGSYNSSLPDTNLSVITSLVVIKTLARIRVTDCWVSPPLFLILFRDGTGTAVWEPQFEDHCSNTDEVHPQSLPLWMSLGFSSGEWISSGELKGTDCFSMAEDGMDGQIVSQNLCFKRIHGVQEINLFTIHTFKR